MPYFGSNSGRISGLGGLKSEVLLGYATAWMGGWAATLLRTGSAAKKAAKHAKALLILMVMRLKQIAGAKMELAKEAQRSSFLLDQVELLNQRAAEAAAQAPATAGLGCMTRYRVRKRRRM